MDMDSEQPETNGDSAHVSIAHSKSTTSPTSKIEAHHETLSHSSKPHKRPDKPHQSSATSNTITVLHSNTQPNLSLLKHFGYLPEDPSPDHPLYTNLKTLTWLQLLDPGADALYQEPEVLSEGQIANLKSGKRGVYYRKRRRWEKVKAVVDEARGGGFDALVVASSMEPAGIMKHLVPLVRGGGQIVVYSSSPESLTLLMDLYSRDRKGAYVRLLQVAAAEGKPAMIDEDDFPVNPTLLLNPMLQTARAREWQVLPQRTHPLMTSRGGSEGYLFTATKVLPAQGVRVEARGKFAKKRKVDAAAAAAAAVAAAEKKVKTEGKADSGEAGEMETEVAP
jgi:tRNA (adenine-N(1)-)-methyltransferase non-catalytic subunit